MEPLSISVSLKFLFVGTVHLRINFVNTKTIFMGQISHETIKKKFKKTPKWNHHFLTGLVTKEMDTLEICVTPSMESDGIPPDNLVFVINTQVQ